MVTTGKKQGRGGVLNYRPASREVNELHLTFNKMARTMMNTFDDEKCSEEKALLNLADTYNVFEEFKNPREQAVCITNIGAIMKKKGDLKMANLCFEESTFLMTKVVEKPLSNEK